MRIGSTCCCYRSSRSQFKFAMLQAHLEYYSLAVVRAASANCFTTLLTLTESQRSVAGFAASLRKFVAVNPVFSTRAIEP
jgi:hypothetical protein